MTGVCVVAQPTYLPWVGYFDLLNRADHFVFLDDVKFVRQSWHNRNRILISGSPSWLTVPVTQVDSATTITDVRTDTRKPWQRKHSRTIEQAYARAPFRNELEPILSYLRASRHERLCELNIGLIMLISDFLDIDVQVHRSSALGVRGQRSRRIEQIVELLECDVYLSQRGSREYLLEDHAFQGTACRLVFHDFEPPPYPQIGVSQFISHLSIIDALANVGPSEVSRWLNTSRSRSSSG